jgi:hypothetical protein
MAAWKKACDSRSDVRVLFPVFRSSAARPEAEKVCVMRVSSYTPEGVFLDPAPLRATAISGAGKERASGSKRTLADFFAPTSKTSRHVPVKTNCMVQLQGRERPKNTGVAIMS